MPITTYTLADIRQRLQDRLGGVPWWTTAALDDAINDTLCLWNFFTGQWRTRETYLTAANTYDYGLNASLVFGARVQYLTFPLAPTSLWELDQGRPGWRDDTTATGGEVPTRPMVWAPVSLSLIHIWPKPVIGNEALIIDGVAATPVLLEEDDHLDLAEEQLTALLEGALHAAAFSEGTDRFFSTEPSWQAFLRAAGEQNQQLKRSAQFRRWLGLDKGRSLRPTRGGPIDVPPSLAASPTGGGSS